MTLDEVQHTSTYPTSISL